MSIFNLHIHEVDHVSIDTERETFDTGAGQTIHRIDIHATDRDGKPVDYRLTLYGPRVLSGSKDVPIEFSNREDEPPPALKLEMERDLKGALAMGKVWGEVFDNLFARSPQGPTAMTHPYRPSNGTEGELFCEDWCYRCSRDPDNCEILTRTLIYDIGDPEYPKEWIENEEGPQCTAFEEHVN